MKQLLKKAQMICAATLLLVLNTNAQSPDTSTTEKLIRYVIQPLDKSQVPTGFLEEYSAPFISMRPFNGILTDSNTVDMNAWRILYFQLQTAYCGIGTNPLPAITSVNNAIRQNVDDEFPVPVPILIGQYNSVKSYAFSSNLLAYNYSTNQVFDVAGRPENPYLSNILFAAAPNEKVNFSGTASFVCRPELIWNNTGKAINQIQIDFANGQGFQNISIGSPVTVNYSDTGIKRWTIKVTLNDNSVVQCYNDYNVLNATHNPARFGDGLIVPAPWGPITVNDGAEINIAYSDRIRTNTLRKPLIVVEGYDISLVAPNVQDDYTINDFIRAISEPTNIYDFNTQLDDIAGYDLVFVNFNNGTDDIVRNSEIVEEVIRQVNAHKVPDDREGNIIQQNVVMGLSMGGLVARYALAHMTKTNVNTETRLLITHDSPHRGANVPLGLQYLIQMVGQAQVFGFGIRDIMPQYDEAINLLGEPATEQLLIYRSTGPTSFSNNTFLNGNYRTMISFGPNDPQPTYRFIATSQGNECGAAVFQPYTRLLNADADIFLFYVPLLSYRFHTTAEAYALPLSGANKIARFKLSSKFKLFGLITINKDEYNNTAYSSGTQLAVDGVPGGQSPFVVNTPSFNAGFTLFPLFLFWTHADAQLSGSPTNFTFVPTASALDVDPFNTAALNDEYVNGTNSTFRSTSATFVTQETNTIQGITNNVHLRFTARNSQWLFNEMENQSNNLNCSNGCANTYYISGPDQLCTSAIFDIPGLPRGATVNWTQSPSGVVAFTSNTGFPVTVSRVSSGTVTITATITGACTGNVVLGKTFDALAISGPSSVCNNSSSYYTVNLPSGGSVVWSSSPSGKVTLTPISPNAVEATPINDPAGSYTLIATVTGYCTTTTQVSFYSTPPPPYDCYEIGNGTCSQTQYLCTEQFFTEKGFTIPNNIPGVPYWHWVVYGGTFSDGTTDKIVPRSTNMMTVTPQYGYMSYVIYITPVSECMVENYSPFSYVVINTNQPWPCDGYYFTMAPNPASSDITVSAIENSSKSGTVRSITGINIYNQQGMLRKQKQFGKVKKASLSISDLANGVYIVEIISGDYKERKQLLVKH